MQDIATNVELKALVCATRSFLLWPKTSKNQEGETDDFKKESSKVSVLTLKLNTKILMPFVGWSTLFKKLGHVDFLCKALFELNKFWGVPLMAYSVCIFFLFGYGLLV